MEDTTIDLLQVTDFLFNAHTKPFSNFLLKHQANLKPIFLKMTNVSVIEGSLRSLIRSNTGGWVWEQDKSPLKKSPQ